MFYNLLFPVICVFGFHMFQLVSFGSLWSLFEIASNAPLFEKFIKCSKDAKCTEQKRNNINKTKRVNKIASIQIHTGN